MRELLVVFLEFENDRAKETDRLRRLLANAEDDKRDLQHKVDILEQARLTAMICAVNKIHSLLILGGFYFLAALRLMHLFVVFFCMWHI